MNSNTQIPYKGTGNGLNFPGSSNPEKNWSLADIARPEVEKPNTLVKRWYALTTPAESPEDTSFVQREAARKSHLLSTVLFFYTLVIIVFLPCCLLLPNRYDFWIDAILIVLSFVALGLNRRNMTVAAGLLVVIAFQVALTVIIFTTTPFDEPSIQIYDLFIMTELLAVSLLSPRSVFIVATVNSGVILISLLYEPHTLILAKDLQEQFIPIMIRPIALQFIIAGVAYVWVYSTLKAIVRADRVEMVATLEHALVEQKRDLEWGITQILQTHVAIANGNLSARAPLTEDNTLWQIARALNTLLTRLQRAVIAEKELDSMKQAIHFSINAIHQTEKQQQPLCLNFTHTAIDPFIAALQGKTFSYIHFPSSYRTDARNPTGAPPSPIHTKNMRD